MIRPGFLIRILFSTVHSRFTKLYHALQDFRRGKERAIFVFGGESPITFAIAQNIFFKSRRTAFGMRYCLVILLFVLASGSVLGATVSGAVYDLNLRQVTTAVVTVNTAQEQRMVTRGDGSYYFRLSPGNYTLMAKATIGGTDMRAAENITITDDSDYVIDLILSPSFTSEENLTIGEPPQRLAKQSPRMPLYAAGVLIILGVAVIGFLIQRRKHEEKEDDEYKAAVLHVLKDNDGRATQHDIRRSVSFSEAKVSLVITELESEGVVRKVKKGRGNIIILR
jgi:uncharacterized membrane protein